ncbi:MAG: prepilin-type N-terminal cleavage/methylation domain-containing protein [Gammaproteobacteria bacterium]|uniref:type IV pilin protein n=1 Tax=Pseudomaricurvus alcaniphilus TaxID=1166482 RepID=UPI0014097247|nr:type IV pilin protein [Pseudomaricurvus alcaniphilus]MBR9913103.1 prepilin-type N-terminal cleavage/methylation domain-containing protein [Gammaproteobacteria bacterium]NHN39302.1 prepilin-type N-terminal cleavage/methylation domain-containing protein [Pseudomaricurvus alcaniphilus]
MKQARGFTLIELLIALVIISILASIALPAYQESTIKARRADARAALSSAAAEQEKWFFQFNGYTDDIDDLGGAASPEGFYTLTLSINAGVGTCVNAAPFNCYTLTATPTVGGPQEDDDDCTTLVVTHTGARSATGSNTERCW